MSKYEPEGDIVTGPPAKLPQNSCILKVEDHQLPSTVSLVPLSIDHSTDLFLNLCGPHNDHLYTYMPNGPFHTIEALQQQIEDLLSRPHYQTYSIFSSHPRHISNQSSLEDGQTGMKATAVAMIAYLNFVPIHRTIEIGYVLFASTLQRTTEATETCYLLMKHAFEDLGYLRVEWKTNSFNEASRRAALRLGFVFEGIFRKHWIVRGRRRDTAWFSVTDDEWFGTGSEEGRKPVKKALEMWLDRDNFNEDGSQKKKLESFRTV